MIEKHSEKTYGFCFDTLNIVFRIIDDPECKKDEINGKSYCIALIEEVQSLKELCKQQKRAKLTE